MMQIHTDILGEAVSDYFKTHKNKRIKVCSNINSCEYLNSAYFFRQYREMPELEQIALDYSHGYVLDVGACAGSHSLYLQDRNIKVTALDISPLCCKIMEVRGLKRVVNEDIFVHKGKYDTILMLMNGIGIAGTLQGLKNLLLHAKTLLNSGGCLIFDSSDIDYMFTEEDGSKWINLNSEYYGEVIYQFEYKKRSGDKFNWLFIDKMTVKQVAGDSGYKFNLLAEGKHFDYLASLELIS